MQLFYSHGISCDRVETEALKLSTHGPSNPDEGEPLKVYNDMLDSLGRFLITINRICELTKIQKLCRRKQIILKVLSRN